jgi:hypothetical protein
MTAHSTLSPEIAGGAEGLTLIAWNPAAFADRCREIVETSRGHEAHRALDLLTNDVLRSLGFGEGINIFERAVDHWHREADPYPYSASCPDCEVKAA